MVIGRLGKYAAAGILVGSMSVGSVYSQDALKTRFYEFLSNHGIQIHQTGNGNIVYYQHRENPPRQIIIPDKNISYTGTNIQQDRRQQRSTARRYDYRPETLERRARERIELEKNKHRIIRLP